MTAKIIDFEYWQDVLALRKLAKTKPKEKEHVRERTQETPKEPDSQPL